MSLIRTAVRWRHGTGVLFCLLALFGILALFQLPLELQPGGDRPEISISTPYLGASPAEVEDLVTRPIEERLEEVQGVQEIASTSRAGISNINVEFDWGSDIDRSLVDVLNKLQQVEALPIEADESDVEVVSSSSRPMMWVNLTPKEGFTVDANRYRDLVDEVILPRFLRVQGVGQFLAYGGREKEVEVVVDPKALSDRNLTIGDVAATLRNNNRDIRGGPLVLGRREYRVRTVSRIQDVEQLESFVLRRDESGTVYLGDVAEARMGRGIQDGIFLRNNELGAAVGIIRQVGGNVPEISAGIREALVDLEARFDRQGEGVTFNVPYDENDYIDQSIAFVRNNLIIGAILAALILLLFLGSLRTVGVIAIAIPTTLITVFIVFYILGRSLNVISLAGLAFAVGMVVDNAIVVLENIFTQMQHGKTPMKAAIDGTQEVGGAMLASTLTTVAVFAPIVLVTGEAGQLFFDIGIALSAFLLSLVITYLLLIALYRSFIYPLLIMATVPMGMTGALLSLVIANAIPGVVVPLDMITGLGFVILTGVVVNNAILLVDRALQLQSEGMEYNASVYNAVGDRLRPIFMSAGTSILGMLPLAILPGKGAELYQGLGIALTGGLALSTFLTPTVVPALMGLLQDSRPRKSIERQKQKKALAGRI